MSLIEKEELVKKIEDTISWYRVHSSMIMERQLNYDKEIEVMTTMMSCIAQMPTVDAMPIEWIKEWIEEYHEYASRVTITWLLDDWEQEKTNESD